MNSQRKEAINSFFPGLFPKQKPATLPQEVIDAVRLYTQEEHKTILADWLKNGERNAVDAEGHSLLHHCVAAGKSNLLTFLLKKKLQQDLEDNRGFTPLIYGVLEIGRRDSISGECQTSSALRTSILSCIDVLLQNHAVTVSSGIFPQVAVNVAAVNGDLETLQLLQRFGAPINEDNMGTPLWWAEHIEAKYQNPELIAYLQSKNCTATLGSNG